jgi:3-methyladenine DNA glycosylase Tag
VGHTTKIEIKMNEKENLYKEIDLLIETIDDYKNEPEFSIEKNRRQNKIVSDFKNDNEILKTFAYLIAYSQNANSELVEQILESGNYDNAFENFEIDKVAKLNPCDIADNSWESIKGIRQQGKLFHIVTLARKIKVIGSFYKLLNNINIPKEIKTEDDIENFWKGFDILLKTLKENKIPFFQSTTSLLHFLLESGYDCVKPDLVVMKVAKKLKFVEEETGDKNFRKAVRVIQEYSLKRNVRPTIIDFYFLIDEAQRGAKKYVKKEFYKRNK